MEEIAIRQVMNQIEQNATAADAICEAFAGGDAMGSVNEAQNDAEEYVGDFEDFMLGN